MKKKVEKEKVEEDVEEKKRDWKEDEDGVE